MESGYGRFRCVGSDTSVYKLIRRPRKRHPLFAYILIYVEKGMVLCSKN